MFKYDMAKELCYDEVAASSSETNLISEVT